jgi:bidirectional [NiFe] hydrogenase diaphorase subunit
MINIILNRTEVQAEEGWTILDACRFYGIEIPTLCYREGLSPYGACRLCTVEIGEGDKARMVSSCTYPVSEGLVIRTHTKRVVKARKMLVELLVSMTPSSKVIQDLASALHVTRVRFEPKRVDCILCGLCVRMCAEQMDGRAIGFVDRGKDRRITTPFDIKSDVCRLCGGCIWICPACQARCQGPDEESLLCNACLKQDPTCFEIGDDYACWMAAKGECGTCVQVVEVKEEK